MFAKSGNRRNSHLIVNYGGPVGEDYWFLNSEVHDKTPARLNHVVPHRPGGGVSSTKGTQSFARDGAAKDEYEIFPKLAAQIWPNSTRRGLVAAAATRDAGSAITGTVDARERRNEPRSIIRCGHGSNGSKELSAGRGLGGLEPGKRADLVIRQKSPRRHPQHQTHHSLGEEERELFEGSTLNEVVVGGP